MSEFVIESEAEFSWGAVAFALAGVVMALISIPEHEPGWIVASAPFWTLALVLFLRRQKEFSATLTQDGIQVKDSGEVIRYSAIESFSYPRITDGKGNLKSQQAPIHIFHESGQFTIPRNINVSSEEVFDFLRSRTQDRNPTSLPSLLEDYANEQAETFGDDKVFCFGARRSVQRVRSGRAAGNLGLALLLAAVIWGIAGACLDVDWMGGAIILLVIAGFMWLLTFVRSPSPITGIANWQKSGLVVTPVGLAMVQGNLKGRMTWAELRSVDYREGTKSFHISSNTQRTGIQLKMDGSALIIVDLYDQPLATIHDRIMEYWANGR
ncbi:MAG: hypothetical protein R3C49_09720 [Planctomycetaceae bacterium]